jgi:SAM-dependent methyltransferase
MYICGRYEVRRLAARAVSRAVARSLPNPLECRLTKGQMKRLVLSEGFATTDAGELSWFYSAFDRGDADPLTNYTLSRVATTSVPSARVLVTGCGTGITAFWLADQGFGDVTGIDLLPECITVADKIRQAGGYEGVQFAVGDCLNPDLAERYDVITALHWLFSAWMGNYGNLPASFEPEKRERHLSDFVAGYAPHLATGGRLLLELTDAVTDYRLPTDHPLGDESVRIYPVRHTPEQVRSVARKHGLEVTDQQLCVSYGHHPRTMYELTRV